MISNQTNLALKGMIGIQAMAVIANETGNAADAANFSSIADDYITKWQELAINKDANPPHTTLSYGDSSSHGRWPTMSAENENKSLITCRSFVQPLRRRPAEPGSGSSVCLPDAEQLLPDCREQIWCSS